MDIKDTCSACRSCCKSVQIPFKKDSEAGIIIKKFFDKGWLEDHKLFELQLHPDFWVYNSNGKGCIFLHQRSYTCTIHEIKPIVCKMFPLKWDNDLKYYIALCPLSFVIPLKEIYEWNEGNESELIDITYYVNPEESNELLPISNIFDRHKKFREIFLEKEK